MTNRGFNGEGLFLEPIASTRGIYARASAAPVTLNISLQTFFDRATGPAPAESAVPTVLASTVNVNVNVAAAAAAAAAVAMALPAATAGPLQLCTDGAERRRWAAARTRGHAAAELQDGGTAGARLRSARASLQSLCLQPTRERAPPSISTTHSYSPASGADSQGCYSPLLRGVAAARRV